MDIVSRLKKYISHLDIQTTLFADNCKIPRPTLSQLLNGRNKKVSDELINKIHVAYPDLSMLWLMFGEGDMLITPNIETSEPQNSGMKSLFDEEFPTTEPLGTKIDFGNNVYENRSEKKSDNKNANPELLHTSLDAETAINDRKQSSPPNTITFSTAAKKKIVNIIVYYNDNSFESFLPSNNND